MKVKRLRQNTLNQKKKDTIEEVNINLFDKETEDNQREQVNISCKVEEQQEEQEEEEKEEPKEEEPEVKEEPTENSLSIRVAAICGIIRVK